VFVRILYAVVKKIGASRPRADRIKNRIVVVVPVPKTWSGGGRGAAMKIVLFDSEGTEKEWF
jgi:hypothetical protein